MILIVLAAGKGSRLPRKFRSKPKCMVKINHKTILEHNESFFKKFEKKYIILGYKHKMCDKLLKKLKFKKIINKKFKSTNMVFSLFKSKKFINQDIVISYGDVIFNHKIFDQLKSKILAESLPVSIHPLRTKLIASIYDVYQVHLSNSDNFDLQDRKKRIEDQLQRTIKLLSDIHQEIYQETINEHEELYFQAELELTSLRSILPPIQWRDAVDEVIRDKLRQRYPSLRVGVVWDMINQS